MCKTEPLCTLPHILSACPFSLLNKRYDFRHDSVVKVFLEGVEDQIGKKLKSSSPSTFKVKFIRPGEAGRPKCRRYVGLLDQAKDWSVLADLGPGQLIFPVEIFATSERPDIVLYSVSKKIIILIENTSGCEERHTDNHSKKVGSYDNLVDAIRGVGWKCHFFAIEVGARGFNSRHVPHCLKSLGFPPKSVKEMLQKLSRTALQTSYQIWLAHNDVGWIPPVVEWQSKFPIRPIPFPHESSPLSNSPADQESVSSETIDFCVHRDVLQNKESIVEQSGAPIVTQDPKLSYSLPQVRKKHAEVRNSERTPETSKEATVAKESQTIQSASLASSKVQFRRPFHGLVNMGNTCYVNAILVAMFTLRELWDFSSSSPFLQSLRLVLMTMNTGSGSLEPKSFLQSLRKYVREKKNPAFRCNEQHDASEILVYVLEEVRQFTQRNPQLMSFDLLPSYRCQSCGYRETREGSPSNSMLNLQVSESVTISVQMMLSGGDVWRHCKECNTNRVQHSEQVFATLPDVLIIRLLRDQFDTQTGVSVKLRDKVRCDTSVGNLVCFNRLRSV